MDPLMRVMQQLNQIQHELSGVQRELQEIASQNPEGGGGGWGQRWTPGQL